jgi:triosephosphate isomerase
MAREVGCTRVLVGHSERRSIFGETNKTTGLKILAARNAGLLPILCVGETLTQRKEEQQDNIVRGQLADGLQHLAPDQLSGLIIAYEPVWAIGTGIVSSPQQAQDMHLFIRNWLRKEYPKYIADETKIIYGGSVKPANVREIITQPDIDGALVGGASLDPITFSQIIAAAKEC